MSKNGMMEANTYYTSAGIVFIFAFLVHGSRVLNGWDVFIGDWLVPMWLSYVLVVVAAVLAYQSFQMKR